MGPNEVGTLLSSMSRRCPGHPSVGVDPFSRRVAYGGMLRDAVGDVVLQFACAAYDFGIIEHRVGEDLPKMAHGHDREHVGRHEVRIDAGVVAGRNRTRSYR